MHDTPLTFDGDHLLGSAAPHRLLRWYLGRIVSGDSDGLVDDVASLFTDETNPAVTAGFMADRFDDLAGLRLIEVLEESDEFAIALVETARGVRWRAMALADPTSGAFRRVGSAQAPRPGVTVRPAEPFEGARIAEMVRSSPIAVGDDTLLLDYGDDYLVATAMADDRLVLIAEHNGEIVGLHGRASVDLRYDHEILRCAYIRHTRVAPQARGLGIFSALNGALFEHSIKHQDTPLSLVAVANDAMRSKLPPALAAWGTAWERFHLDTVELAGGTPPPPVGDLSGATSLIVAAQGNAGLALPVSDDWLTERLERAPWLYNHERLCGAADAVLGVCARPITIERTGSNAGAYREAIAYDAGMAPGASSAFLNVVRGWCTRLAAAGIDRLTVGCGKASPIRDVLAPLASEHERFLLNFAKPPPHDAEPSIAFDHALM